jgi:hypothetical protein
VDSVSIYNIHQKGKEMSDNQERLLENLRIYVKMNLDGCEDREFNRILQNIMSYIILIEDDE